MEEALTKQEAADALGISERTVDIYIGRGVLQPVKFIGVTKASVNDYQKTRKQPGRPKIKKGATQ